MMEVSLREMIYYCAKFKFMSWQQFALKVQARFLPFGLLCVIGPSFLTVFTPVSPTIADFIRGLGVPFIIAGFIMKTGKPAV